MCLPETLKGSESEWRMTREEAIFELRHHRVSLEKVVCAKDFTDAIEMAIRALEQEPCEDAISRQAAIKAMNDIEEEDKDWFPKDFDAERAIEALKKLPSVTPQQKMGTPLLRTMAMMLLQCLQI